MKFRQQDYHNCLSARAINALIPIMGFLQSDQVNERLNIGSSLCHDTILEFMMKLILPSSKMGIVQPFISSSLAISLDNVGLKSQHPPHARTEHLERGGHH